MIIKRHKPYETQSTHCNCSQPLTANKKQGFSDFFLTTNTCQRKTNKELFAAKHQKHTRPEDVGYARNELEILTKVTKTMLAKAKLTKAKLTKAKVRASFQVVCTCADERVQNYSSSGRVFRVRAAKRHLDRVP